MNIIIKLLVITFLIFPACSEKQRTDEEIVKTNMELITAHPWKLKDRWRDGESLIPQYDACFLDNKYTYTEAGMYVSEDVGEVCNPPQGMINTVFEIRESDDSLFWSEDPYYSNAYFKVTKLTETELEFRMNYAGYLWEYAYVKF